MRDIYTWPSLVLRQKSKAASPPDAALSRLVEDMLRVMAAHGGAGLAAIQVGLPVRVFVTSMPPHVFVNPEITERSPEKELMKEACLSLPGIVEEVRRHVWVRWKAQDLGGGWQEGQAHGFKAQVIQHELEHLDGKIFADRLDPGAKDRIRARLRGRL